MGGKASKRKPIDFIVDENGCFNCTSHHLDKDGYPKLMVDKKFYRLSRFVYEQCFGEIAEKHVIRHKCDNPSCINPEHLETGTLKDNSDDKYKRNRQKHYSGSENPNSKLNENDVENIRVMLDYGGLTITEIARYYEISRANVRKIRDGVTWRKNQEIKA